MPLSLFCPCLEGIRTAATLRRDLAAFMLEHGDDKLIAGNTFRQWVLWDAKCDIASYTRRIAQVGWGGGVEIAAFSSSYDRDVFVYEALAGLMLPMRLKRVSSFLRPQMDLSTPPLHLLYIGRAHYEVLEEVSSPPFVPMLEVPPP